MKITFWAGICLVLSCSVIVVYSAMTMKTNAVQTRNESIEKAKAFATAVAGESANEIKAELEIALDAARTMAQALSVIKNSEENISFNREQVNGILRSLLEKNPDFLGVYTCWEPNTFDGMDDTHTGKTGHDQTGRFVPYWSRDKAGKIMVEPLLDYDKKGPGDYYQLPRNTKKECIIDPYIYPVQGKMVLITSLVAPIIEKDVFYGIVGVDIRLDSLQTLADSMNLYDGTAESAIISNNGTLVAVKGKGELAGKHMQELHKNWQQDLEHIQKSEKTAENDEGRIAVFIPLHIGQTVTPWNVNINIPIVKVTTAADMQMNRAIGNMWKMILMSLACLVAAIGALWILIRFTITEKVKQTVKLANDIAGGDMTKQITVDTADEIGELAAAMNKSASNLSTMLLRIIEHAENLAGSSEEMSAVSTQLAGRSGEASTGIGTMAAAVEQMSVNAQGVSSTAEQISAIVNSIASAIEEMTNSINDIAHRAKQGSDISQKAMETSQSATQTINALGQAASEIGEVTEVIKQIAQQTNLLALNATIEAASAGEVGKGFAVVANEIKELAGQSKQSAEDIAKRIKGVQVSAEKTIQAIGDVSGIIGEINESSVVITQSVEQQALTAGEISANVQESKEGVGSIAASIAEIAKGILDIAETASVAANNVNDISTGVRQVETSSGDLAKFAGDLQNMTTRFKVKKTTQKIDYENEYDYDQNGPEWED